MRRPPLAEPDAVPARRHSGGRRRVARRDLTLAATPTPADPSRIVIVPRPVQVALTVRNSLASLRICH